MRIAAIDLGTVSSRLLLGEVEDGTALNWHTTTRITDLGEGVDATGRLSAGAMARVADACAEFIDGARAYGAKVVSTTLTSAARDAENGEDLLDALRALGLAPCVIAGETEARLTFFGVAHDFAGERILVADSGGGSTELALGGYLPGEPLSLDRAVSLDLGCRRITERFLASSPIPADGEIRDAARWANAMLAAALADVPARPGRLVAVGGTATTLVAMACGLAVYDPAYVHLHALTAADVNRCISLMTGKTAAEIAELPGVQAKRAPVLLGGALIVRELLAAGGYSELTVSENSLLAGMAATIAEILDGRIAAVGWTPDLMRL